MARLSIPPPKKVPLTDAKDASLGPVEGDPATDRSVVATSEALRGASERVAKKTYIRLPAFPFPGLDKAYAECKADKTWTTLENTTSVHAVMVAEPEWLTGVLLQAA